MDGRGEKEREERWGKKEWQKAMRGDTVALMETRKQETFSLLCERGKDRNSGVAMTDEISGTGRVNIN